MNDFQVLMFIPETGEFVDLTKYEVANLVDRRSRKLLEKSLSTRKLARRNSFS